MSPLVSQKLFPSTESRANACRTLPFPRELRSYLLPFNTFIKSCSLWYREYPWPFHSRAMLCPTDFCLFLRQLRGGRTKFIRGHPRDDVPRFLEIDRLVNHNWGYWYKCRLVNSRGRDECVSRGKTVPWRWAKAVKSRLLSGNIC